MTVREKQLRVHLWLPLALLLLFLLGPARILGSWGMEVGRANPGDVTSLIADWNAFKMERNRIQEALVFQQVVERQRQLVGVAATDNVETAQLYESVQEYWLTHVLAPLQRVALNPAASCAEAQFALSTLIGMKRQQQMLGLEENATVSRVFQATEEMASLRCRDEALDECVATGRFVQILNLMMGAERQAQLQGKTDDLESWADDALKQCAIYELHFVSKTKGGAEPVTIETVRDGKVPIKFETPPGGLKNALNKPLGDILKGDTPGGNNPFFVSIKCVWPKPLEAVCSPGADSTRMEVRINSLDLKHREFYVDSEISKERIVGEDKFSFDFEGGRFSLEALIKAPKGPAISLPFRDWGNNFYIAHQNDHGGPPSAPLRVNGKNIHHGVPPVIVQFTYEDKWGLGGAAVTDSTEFELIHKPKPKPFPAREREPIRKPLKPRPGG